MNRITRFEFQRVSKALYRPLSLSAATSLTFFLFMLPKKINHLKNTDRLKRWKKRAVQVQIRTERFESGRGQARQRCHNPSR